MLSGTRPSSKAIDLSNVSLHHFELHFQQHSFHDSQNHQFERLTRTRQSRALRPKLLHPLITTARSSPLSGQLAISVSDRRHGYAMQPWRLILFSCASRVRAGNKLRASPCHWCNSRAVPVFEERSWPYAATGLAQVQKPWREFGRDTAVADDLVRDLDGR